MPRGVSPGRWRRRRSDRPPTRLRRRHHHLRHRVRLVRACSERRAVNHCPSAARHRRCASRPVFAGDHWRIILRGRSGQSHWDLGRLFRDCLRCRSAAGRLDRRPHDLASHFSHQPVPRIARHLDRPASCARELRSRSATGYRLGGVAARVRGFGQHCIRTDCLA
jgi:hypothetical protein